MIYQFNDFKLDTDNFSLQDNNKVVEIEPQVFNLICYLIENRDRLITRKEIFEHLWNGKVVLDATLSNHIKHARSALGDNGQQQTVIKTIHGRGYQFIASVNEHPIKSATNSVNAPPKNKHYLKILTIALILTFALGLIQYVQQQRITNAVKRISQYQEAAYNTFITQAVRRDELVEMLSLRLDIKRNMQYEKFFAYYFDQMNGEEKFVFAQIRGMTQTGLFKNNKAILAELNAFPEIFNEIKHTKELQLHLSFWLNKYQSVFQPRQDMCLLYVGVEDGLPYPKDINQVIKNWLITKN